MAANRCRVYKETEIALAAAATAKTVLMVTAATNIALIIHDWCISFDGISSVGEPILCELAKFTSAGTPRGAHASPRSRSSSISAARASILANVRSR